MAGYDDDQTGYLPSLAEELTANFYLWEKRGRGWQVWDGPVELEPPFEQFFHSRSIERSPIDDGRKPGFLKSLFGKLKGASEKSRSLIPSQFIDTDYRLTPSSFSSSSPLIEISVSLPPDQRVNSEMAEQFLLSLCYCSFPLAFELVGTSEAISVQLVCRKDDLLQVRQQLKAYFPAATLSENKLISASDGSKETLVVDFGLSYEFMRPLRTLRNFDADPLIGTIAALENLHSGETGLLQILFQAARRPWAESIQRSVNGSEGRSFFADAPEMSQLAREKIRKPLFAVVIRAAGQSPSDSRIWDIVKGLAGSLVPLASPNSNELIPLQNDDYDDFDHWNDVLLRQSRRGGMLLNSEELVSMVHLPSISVRSEKLIREAKKTRWAPSLATGHAFTLGENIHQGKNLPVTLHPEQRLRHMHVIGATGTGKSTLLINSIIQDIRSSRGVAVLDPHGDLIDQILGHIPEERFEDVVLFDPSDVDYPVGFNILSAHSEVEKNVLASDLVAVFQRLSTSWGDQMTSVLGNAILAFLESTEGGTLAELKQFLMEEDFRNRFLRTVTDQEIVYYWLKEFRLLRGNPQASILTRLNNFLRLKLIRNVVAQKKGLNFNDILNGKKIFLAKLAQGLIGEENAHLLGTLIVSKIHQVVMARQTKDISKREEFYLYIDEFHNFVTPSLASILSGARKYHLGLILAHQELRQLWNRDSELANSVISNPGTRICFRLGDFDAQKLESGFSHFDREDLQNLGTGEAIVRIERAEYDFNLKALPPPQVSPEVAKTRQEKLIALSRRKYGVPREEIEASRTVVLEPEQAKPALRVVKKSGSHETPRTTATPTPVEKSKTETDIPEPAPKGESRHRYLQTLIKKLAEDNGFKAVLEQPTPDGLGRVDVSLERDSRRMAVEISVTSTDEQEIKNIQKCLDAGYEKVVLCSPEKKFLDKIKSLLTEKFDQPLHERILLSQPEELPFFFESEAARQAGGEERVKGYKVKVQYQPVGTSEKKAKREAVAQVILKAMKRMKDEEG